MKDVKALHIKSMHYVYLANEALTLKDKKLYQEYTENAFHFENEAAMDMLNDYDLEPTRSILFRGAATLAYRIGYFKNAKELIQIALSGYPPDEIKEDIAKLYTQIEYAIRNDYIIEDGIDSILIGGDQSPEMRPTNRFKKSYSNLTNSNEWWEYLYYNYFHSTTELVKQKLSDFNLHNIEPRALVIDIFEKIAPQVNLFNIERIAKIINVSARNMIFRYKKINLISKRNQKDLQKLKNDEFEINEFDKLLNDLDYWRKFNSLRIAISQLPREKAVILRLRYFNKLTISEIAQEMNYSTKDINNKLRSGITFLRNNIKHQSTRNDILELQTGSNFMRLRY